MKSTIKKQLALAMCIGAMTTMTCTADAAIITSPIVAQENATTELSDDVDINIIGGTDQKAITLASPLSGNYPGTKLDLTGNVHIKSALGNYAIYVEAQSNSGTDGILNINTNNNRTVQIVGDVVIKHLGANSGGGSSGVVNMNLSDSDSYFAGDISISRLDSTLGTGRGYFKLNLSNGATWYPGGDTYTWFTADYEDNISIISDGGIIDIAHSLPRELRPDIDTARTFTISDIGNYATWTDNTTFHIASQLNSNNAQKIDKIVLNGSNDGYYSEMPTLTHTIKVVADPTLTMSGDSVVDLSSIATSNLVVATVDGTKLIGNNANNIDGNTTFTGGTYIGAAINGGLSTADIITDISNEANRNEWVLKGMEVQNVVMNNGPAALMAEVGAAAMSATASAWRADNNDLMRRMGDLRNGSGESGAWGKIYGGQSEVRKGVGSKLDYQAVQVGYDRQVQLNSGKLVTGLALSHLRGDTTSVAGTGDLNSTMFGVYGSYIGERGHFADLIVKYGHMNNKINRQDTGSSYSGEYSANGINISAEYGYRHNFKHNLYVEPQIELTYNNIGGSDYTMRLNGADGARIHNDAYKSLIGRIGFTLGKQYKQNNVYLKLSLAHEFQGDVGINATYNGISIDNKINGKNTWLEYGIGFNVMSGKNTNFYGEIEKNTSTVVRNNWRAQLGLRYSF